MNFFAAALLASGLVSLGISLYYAHRICKIIQQNRSGWSVLRGLMAFFILGYLAYGALLFSHPVDISDIIVSVIFCGGGLFVAMVVRMSMLSIEDMKRVAALDRHRALHDDVTNLPNRTLLHEHIDQAIIDAQKNSTSFGVILIDLDRFSEVNNTLGHFYGDYLLQLMVPRFRKCVMDHDMVSRLGSDEFVLIVKNVDRSKAEAIALNAIEIMKEPFSIEGQELTINITIGIALYPEHGIESENLLQHANVAMDFARSKENKIFVYTPENDRFNWDRLMLIGELREAIRRDQLVLHYQPKISLVNDQVCGVEALLRWQHPDNEGLIPPDTFIHVAEQTGLIDELTYWVLDHAFAQKAEWLNNGLDLIFSINLSIKNLHDLSFPDQVQELMQKWNIDSKGIILEITESSMILDPERAYAVIFKLHELGLRLSIDDFGTGYSSLSYLKQLPATELKVDKSFVKEMISDENDQVIVRTTIDLAKNMGMQVVAEGVEDEQVLGMLKDLGCDSVQGYHLCRPLPPQELFAKLKQD